MPLSSAISFRTCPRRRKQVVCIDCRQRQNGNTLAALVAKPRIVLERAQNRWATTLGLRATATIRRTLLVRRRQTLGAYSIFTGMFTNCAATGTVNIPRVQSAIRLHHGMSRGACPVAAFGAMLTRIVGRRSGTSSPRRSGATPSASALP
jgi:hypothetical protein